jgi:hypothetical protein
MTAPLMLFEDIPLITTDKLGAFFESKPIGHHYGDLSRSKVRCIKIDSSTYLVAAHACKSITACFIDGKKTDGFEAQVIVGTDGVARQCVVLTTPAASNSPIVEVSLIGKVNPANGKLLENPDEIIENVASLSGRTLNFPLFREQCNKRGIRIAGSVYEVKSLRHYVNEIIESVGAKWLGDNAVFYPDDALGYAIPIEASSVAHEINMGDVAGKLVIYYAWNHAADRHGAYLELTAKGCQYDNKAIFYAKWIRLARDAEALGRRLLAKRAGEFVKTTIVAEGIVRAGQVVAVEDSNFSGEMLVLSSEPNEVSSAITGEIILQQHEYMEVTQFSNENSSVRSERIDVLLDLEKREALITVFDAQNRPMAGILITYDGAITKQTNKVGSATFSVSSGNHTLVLEGEGIDNNDPYPLTIP